MTNFSETTQIIIAVSTPIITGIIGILYGGRKKKAEATRLEIENVVETIGIYKRIADDLEREMSSLKQEMILLKKQNAELLRKLDEELREKHVLRVKLETMERKLTEIQNFNNG